MSILLCEHTVAMQQRIREYRREMDVPLPRYSTLDRFYLY